jgi:hypothetical protein
VDAHTKTKSPTFTHCIFLFGEKVGTDALALEQWRAGFGSSETEASSSSSL